MLLTIQAGPGYVVGTPDNAQITFADDDATPSDAPSGLTAVAAAADSVDLMWVDNSSNESGFKIYRSTDGTTFEPLMTVGANAQSYTDDSAVDPQQTYYYRVRSYTTISDSADSKPRRPPTCPRRRPVLRCRPARETSG